MSSRPSSGSILRPGCAELIADVYRIRYVIDAYLNVIDDAALSGRLTFLLADVERAVSTLVTATRGAK